MLRYRWLIGLSLLLGTGCATLQPARLGQVVGTIAGAAAIPGIGAPIGGLLGILAGSAFQREVDKLNEGRERVELSEQLHANAHPPGSAAAEMATLVTTPTRVWVDEVVQDGQLIAGHFDTRALH